jgi:UDP-N-acetylmuramoyl-L-alanyl-D-glutamate--2,6-diaminopimelate ligase
LQEFCFIENAYQCKIVIDGKVYPCTIPVLGEFNLENALAVIATLIAEGIDIPEALRQVECLRPVRGRMEIIKGAKADAPMMVVDYAHTPDALQKVLETLRPIAAIRQGQIYCVFGCGGDRDREKRPMMGQIAREGSDHLVITSDNPRSEDPLQIMQMIFAGVRQATNRKEDSKTVEMIADRAAAIMSAVRQASPQDIVLVAGKGHETTQEMNGKRFDFSDQAHLRLASGGAV